MNVYNSMCMYTERVDRDVKYVYQLTVGISLLKKFLDFHNIFIDAQLTLVVE